MPVFLSGLQAGERKKQETSEISFAFLVIHQLGVNDLTLLFPVPKHLPSLWAQLNHPVPLPVAVCVCNSVLV